MFGRLAAGLIVIGLAIGVWLLWPGNDGTPVTSTMPTETTVSSSSEPAITTTTPPPGSTTDSDTVEVIDTVEEAEELLRNLWFGWFEGIYLEDEERIKEVVASQNQLDAAVAAFGVMTFDFPPTPEGIVLTEIEILRADSECTAVWAKLEVTFRAATTEGVHLLRIFQGTWHMVNLWQLRGDLWSQDCAAQLEPLS
ncbi:MAG: hypothetical protein OEM32_09780 [Acidimicrobiia bacterium]|nr:hypothetical protein [Acidimicrobiia bacterium]